MIRDVVYMLKPDPPFEELRYSLRSLVNLPHGQVWLVGGRPDWLSASAMHRNVRQAGLNKFAGAGRTFSAASTLPTSEEFYLFHDDMFVVSPVPEVPRFHRCTWGEWTSGRSTAHGARWAMQTERLMRSLDVPLDLSYEVHVPMVMNRSHFREFLARVAEIHPGQSAHTVMGSVCKRSAYGNFVAYGGQRVPVDPKLRRDRRVVGPFLSSSGEHVPSAVLEAFPDPSPYELSGPSHFYPLNA